MPKSVQDMMRDLEEGRGAGGRSLAIDPFTKRLRVMPTREARDRNLMQYQPEDKDFWA